MARAETANYEELVLQVEDQSTPGTWNIICGLRNVSITRQAQVDTVEIPDCDDESLPDSIERSVRSLDFQISGTGVWAKSSHGTLMDWLYSASRRNIRIQHVAAAVGETEFEQGPALFTELSNERTKGQKVTASVQFQFDGTPTRIAKAAPGP